MHLTCISVSKVNCLKCAFKHCHLVLYRLQLAHFVLCQHVFICSQPILCFFIRYDRKYVKHVFPYLWGPYNCVFKQVLVKKGAHEYCAFSTYICINGPS